MHANGVRMLRGLGLGEAIDHRGRLWRDRRAKLDDLFRARILAAVHARESDNISRRVRRKQQELAERGRPHGLPRRYGYRVDLSAIEPDEASLIKDLARRTLAGESLASLCRGQTNVASQRQLVAAGVPRPCDASLSAHT